MSDAKVIDIGSSPSNVVVSLRGIDSDHKHISIILKANINADAIELSIDDILFISAGIKKFAKLLEADRLTDTYP
jgi:hypothetical protein